MQNVSDLYREIKSGEHWCEVKLSINGVEYLSTDLEAVSTVANVFGKEVPSVGNVVSRTLTASLLTPQVEIPIGAEVKLYVRIYNREKQSEWLQKGVFYVDERKRNLTVSGKDSTTEFSAFDAFHKADNTFTGSGTDVDVVAQISQILGVSVDCTLDRGYTVGTPDDLTAREVLGYIGAMYGGSFVINDLGHLDLILLGRDETGVYIDPGVMAIGQRLPGMSKVILHDMTGTKYEAGNTTGRTINVDCPWATQAIADNLLSQLAGYAYYPFETSDVVIDPAFEIGDTIHCDDVTERVYTSSFAYGAAVIASLSAPEVKETDHSYYANKNRLSGGVGRSIGKLDVRSNNTREGLKKTNEHLVKVDAGLDQITDYDPETGYAIAEAALYATIIDEGTGAFKTARISASVVRDENGELKSLSQILSDVIVLNGHLDVLGKLTVRDNNLAVINGGLYADELSSIVHLSSYDISTHELAVAGKPFSPKQITSTSGAVTVLGT